MDANHLYTAQQSRELDRRAIEEHGIPGIRLMSAAGRAAFEQLCESWPDVTRVLVCCGSGNNGGDGYIVAALARNRQIPVTLYQLGAAEKIRGDALLAREQALEAGVAIVELEAAADFTGPEFEGGVIVDALLGTGLSGPPREDYAQLIRAINASGLPVLAIDIPSGLGSDNGLCLGDTVQADHTVTFIGVKQGLVTGQAAAYVGCLHYARLDVPRQVYDAVPAVARRLELGHELSHLAPRARDAHKGKYGHALIVGGDHGMAGAALLAAEAAGRCGSGLVSAATRAEHVAAIVSRRPEIMARGVDSGPDIESMLDKPNAIAVGPGLGRGPWAEQLLQRVLGSEAALVVDADALNILAQGKFPDQAQRDNWILTPHPAEAARLLQCSTAEIQADRYAAVARLQQRYGGVALLKGAGTLVCGGGEVYVAGYGNPGMASGGMGDVLSGILAALLAQGLSPLDAACLGACLHGRAAELAAGPGERGLLAADLMPYLWQLLG